MQVDRQLRAKKVFFFHIMKENFSGAQSNIFRLLLNLNFEVIRPTLIGQCECELTRRCRENKIDVDIIPFPPGLQVYDGQLMKFNFVTFFNWIKSTYLYNKALVAKFKIERPDVLWADNIRTFVTVFLACKISGVKVVWNIWSEPKGKVAWVLHRVGLLFADQINVEYKNQPSVIFGAMAANKIFKKKIVPLYTGVSDFEELVGTNIRDELSLPAEATLVVMASNIVAGKGQLDLIESFQNLHLALQNVFLILCGSTIPSNDESTKYLQKIEAFIEKNDLGRSIKLLGWRSDIRDIYQQSNIYVSTSYSESFPDSVREAMLASLPVIVTDVGGTRELVNVGKNGYLFNPGDLNSLTMLLETLLSDSDLQNTMGENGKKIIEKRFSTKVYAQNFENMIIRILANS